MDWSQGVDGGDKLGSREMKWWTRKYGGITGPTHTRLSGVLGNLDRDWVGGLKGLGALQEQA